MKKTIAFFIAAVMCFSMLSSIGYVFAEKDSDSLTVIDLVRLKKYVIGSFEHNADYDYNGDNTVNSQDLITLNRILLGSPPASVEPDDDNTDSEFDDDGFYNDVIKP